MSFELIFLYLFSLCLQGAAARVLAYGWFHSPYLMPNALKLLAARGWLFGLQVKPEDADVMLRSDWLKLIMQGSVNNQVPNWFFQLMHCPVCATTHIPAVAGFPVAVVTSLAWSAPWHPVHALACLLLGWLSLAATLEKFHHNPQKTHDR